MQAPRNLDDVLDLISRIRQTLLNSPEYFQKTETETVMQKEPYCPDLTASEVYIKTFCQSLWATHELAVGLV